MGPSQVSQPAVLVVSGDPLGPTMAGPAIRAVELAGVLARAGHPVTVAAPAVGAGTPVGPGVVAVAADEAALRDLVGGADVVVAFAPVVATRPWLAEGQHRLVVDAYDPGLLETLERRRGEALNAQRDWVGDAWAHMVDPLRVADVVLVASERQRHLVLGVLAALGRLGPRVVAEDPSLERLVRTVPFGLPDGPPPTSAGRPLSGPDGLLPDVAHVALWGGGLYDWLDPVTLVEAVGALGRPDIGAAFLAGPHPTPAVGRAALVDVAVARADALGLLGSTVAFHERWVPYAERAAWLQDAAVGVALHHRHLETELAFRTRILDYLWAGLPIVCSSGDVLSELVAAEDLGVVVPPGDVDAVAAALASLADEDDDVGADRRRRTAAVAARFRWDDVAAPLVEACASPAQAPDRRVPPSVPGPRARLRSVLRGGPGGLGGRW